jgi:hypothetical protein
MRFFSVDADQRKPALVGYLTRLLHPSAGAVAERQQR